MECIAKRIKGPSGMIEVVPQALEEESSGALENSEKLKAYVVKPIKGPSGFNINVVYEDLPSNLCAIRDYVEKVLPTNDPLQQDAEIIPVNNAVHFPKSKPADKGSSLDASKSLRQRPRVPDLQSNIEVLKAELLKFIAENGQEGFMPVRRQLRLHGRVDIKKAI
ncbi:hypothetical protein J5N97_024404 [Dioscorea zingiberensis]|uniref:Uncharacterized protein n=1 Tax=Dioscorea zingiberensis TaxID=325984 RepID=A0A9D5H8V5_9LILI|nr:hypothetical protein J5N97_024404 [Dioscorea zingiberensis]